jgi:L1 cell adhesion molecule like protein
MFIGIDLGTTHCCISYKDPNTFALNVIDNPQKAGYTIRSVISFKDDEILYNFDAVNSLKVRPESVFYDSKRFIGRTYDNVQENFNLETINFTLENVNNKPSYSVHFKGEKINISPEEMCALILKYAKNLAEDTVDNIQGYVITVPAHFTNIEREATLFASELAGLNVLQLLNEPSAAAISYGFEKGLEGYILVFDFGGGTLDVSVVDIKNNKFDVVGYDGDQILGGRDIDNAILDYCIKYFEKNFDVHHKSYKQRANLLIKCEEAKIFLSQSDRNSVQIIDWNNTHSLLLTNHKFKEICLPFFERSIEILKNFLKRIKIEKNDIYEIVMTGGTCQIPLIREMVEQFFERKPVFHDPETAIAKGAAIVACDYSKRLLDFNLFEQVRYSIGIAIVNTETHEESKWFSKIIESGSKLPCTATRRYFTLEDNQKGMSIEVAEGESEYFNGNSFIDQFILDDLPPNKAGEVYVDVTINVDQSGVLFVTAVETSTSVSKSKKMEREGNFYKKNEKENIKLKFLHLSILI